MKKTAISSILAGIFTSSERLLEAGQEFTVLVTKDGSNHLALEAIERGSERVLRRYCANVPKAEPNRQVLDAIALIANRHLEQL